MIVERTSLTLAEAVELYQSILLTSRNLARRSRREYSDDICDLINFLADQGGINRPERVDRTHLEGYLAELDRRSVAASTGRRNVASIRSFFALLSSRGNI